MTISTTSWPRLLFEGLNKVWGLEQAEWPQEYTDLFDVQNSSKNFEEIIGSTGFGLPSIITEAAPVTYQDDTQGFLSRFVHFCFGTGFIVTEIMKEDNLHVNVGTRRTKKLGFVMRQFIEVYHANIYNRAANSSYVGGDGVELASLVHPFYGGGTFANELSTGSQLSEAAIEQACINIMRWTDDRGNPVQYMPDSLIIPPEEIYNAQRLFESPYRPGGADNDINVLKGKFPGGIKVNHYLTSTTRWFIRNKLPTGEGMISYNRSPIKFTQDNDFDTDNAKYKAKARMSAGWGDPHAIYASGL